MGFSFVPVSRAIVQHLALNVQVLRHSPGNKVRPGCNALHTRSARVHTRRLSLKDVSLSTAEVAARQLSGSGYEPSTYDPSTKTNGPPHF